LETKTSKRRINCR